MFRFVYELLDGQHEELRRRRGPAITFDPVEGTFMAPRPEDEHDGREPWPGRGEVPGAVSSMPAAPTEGLTVADEARELAKRSPR